MLYDQLADGHTCVPRENIIGPLGRLVGHGSPVGKALDAAIENQAIKVTEGYFHSAGAWLMERAVAQFVQERLAEPYQFPLLGSGIDRMLDDFERSETAALGTPHFRLNEAQRAAAKRSFENRFSIITGGAGVGKTTVLKALYRLLDTTGLPRFQMALSGRAAKRMREATGESAYTIVGFLKNVSREEMGNCPVIVIDEASMVDLPSMYRLVRKLPSRCHMVLVGDPYQLPPIGAGLVLHCLVGLAGVPVSELTLNRRNAAHSAIPVVARAIRDGVWPDGLLFDPAAEVAAIPCGKDRILDTVLALYGTAPQDTQILGVTRRDPYAGLWRINRECAARAARGKPLLSYGEPTGFREGEILLYTRNDWSRDLQNGLLGKLVEAFDQPRTVTVPDGTGKQEVEAIGWVEWEGHRVPLLPGDIEHLEYGYAISVHRSQGSQFKRVIVPIGQNLGFLDRTLIYTALTRAREQIILVGDLGFGRK